jgi:hypothetical protein
MSSEQLVVNASPLICLFKSGLHDLLPQIARHIIIPAAVIKEVTAPGKDDFPASQVAAQRRLRGRCCFTALTFSATTPCTLLVTG